MTLQRLSAAACTLLILLSTACAEEKSNPPPHQRTIERWTGTAADVRIRWSADPGIDLLTGPAVAVRAYIESNELADIMFDAEYVYPGYDRAVAPDGPDHVGPRPDLVYMPKYRAVGTQYEHILRIERTGRDVAAVLCLWSYAVASDLGGGKVLVNQVVNSGTELRKVHMIAPAREPTVPLPPQEGPLAAPVDEVFGDWRITASDYGADTITAGPGWPTFTSDLEACVAKAPDPVEKRECLMTVEHTRADFPTLPPYPGWPSAAG